MVSLTITVDNISSIMEVFDVVQIRRYDGSGTPETTVTDQIAMTEYVTTSGTDVINGTSGVGYVTLSSQYSQYYFNDPLGDTDDWYISRYFNTSTLSTSSWSSPVQGSVGDLFNNPQYPSEVEYSSEDQLIIDRLRLYIGDPKNLKREHGSEALESISAYDKKTYKLEEKGWPVYVNMGGVQFNSLNNPAVNGYRFLRFDDIIADTCYECVTYSGCGESKTAEITHGVDIWYYSFRNSDRELITAYDNCPPPPPLNTITATSQVYILKTAIDILNKELLEDSTEDGAIFSDEGSKYDPTKGLEIRRKLIEGLQDELDVLKKSLVLTGITGVRID